MGIYLIPYAVKLEKVKNAFSSNDQKLFEEIIKTSEFRCYSSQDSTINQSGDITTEEALKTIIWGLEKRGRGHSYGYALISICGYLGEELTPEGDVFKLGEINDEMTEFLSSNGIDINVDDMLEPIYDFDIPRINDFPVIGGISRETLIEYKNKLDGLEISDESLDIESDDFDPCVEGIAIYKRAINYCVENDLDWITFAH